MYLAEFLGLKLCGYSMACPGLFLPFLSPMCIRLSSDSLFEVIRALAITKILQYLCAEKSAILNCRLSCPNLTMSGPNKVHHFLALSYGTVYFSFLHGFFSAK